MATLTLSRPSPPPAQIEPPAQERSGRFIHRRASPEVIAENQRLEALWHEERDARRAADDAAFAGLDTLLRDLAPKVFCSPPKPLAIGIHHELIELLAGDVEALTIGRFLGRWVRHVDYLRAVAAGEMRVDLNGYPTEAPTPEQISGAMSPTRIRIGTWRLLVPTSGH